MNLPEGWREDVWIGTPCWRIGDHDNVHAGIFVIDRTWFVWDANGDDIEAHTYKRLDVAIEKATAAYVKLTLTQGAAK